MMTNLDFIKSIIKYYEASRELTVNKSEFNIWRGVSHSISSKAEDLFALFVAERLNNRELEFIVDKTFTLYSNEYGRIQFRPDLAIVKNGKITHIIDLKMDMGYKRSYHETEAFEKEKLKFEIFRRQKFSQVSYKMGKQSTRLTVSKNIINQIVVISEKNEGKENNRIDMINCIDKLDWVNIYYLCGGVHPNNYADNTLEEIKINDSQFELLMSDIQKNL